MRVIGIDPGTGSFDFFGMDDDRVIVDTTVSVMQVSENPKVLLDVIKSVLPLDAIVGPSGYGLPITPVKQMGERELNLMVPDDKSIPLYDGIRMVLRLMKEEGLPVYFTPGVIHLNTVPAYRKANKMDMGTADKVCCTVLALRDQAECLNIDYNKTSFILAEIGYAFNAVMGVNKGKIVDGFGGTAGGPGFITLGSMDAELAIRLGKFPGAAIFTGGAKDASDKADLTPEEMAEDQKRFADSWNMMVESIQKSVLAMMVAVNNPKEILLSGRLSRVPEIAAALTERLSKYAPVRLVGRRARVAKEAAEGAYIIGEGIKGGQYKKLIDVMELNKASGTMYDHILMKGVDITRP
ncbi:MAG: DUF1464 family protein [Dehalococcoidales bacterium]|nr:DUF1464 family protein [Dehalococcoidales bacterium]